MQVLAPIRVHPPPAMATPWRLALAVVRPGASGLAPRRAWRPRCLLTRLGLLTGLDQPGMAQIPPVPTGEGPVLDDLGVHDHLNGHPEERDGLKMLKFVVANLPQECIARLGVGGLE